MTEKQKEKKQGEKTRKDKMDAATSAGNCLSFSVAGLIVQHCVPNPPQLLDQTLEDIGLITPLQREAFQNCVFNGVLNNGCHISKGDIPNGPNTTLRQVRDAVKAAAF